MTAAVSLRASVDNSRATFCNRDAEIQKRQMNVASSRSCCNMPHFFFQSSLLLKTVLLPGDVPSTRRTWFHFLFGRPYVWGRAEFRRILATFGFLDRKQDGTVACLCCRMLSETSGSPSYRKMSFIRLARIARFCYLACSYHAKHLVFARARQKRAAGEARKTAPRAHRATLLDLFLPINSF